MQGKDTANLAQIQPLQTCRQHHALGFSGEHTPASTASLLPNLSISMPICINIFFLQRERGKLPGGSWAGDP